MNPEPDVILVYGQAKRPAGDSVVGVTCQDNGVLIFDRQLPTSGNVASLVLPDEMKTEKRKREVRKLMDRLRTMGLAVEPEENK